MTSYIDYVLVTTNMLNAEEKMHICQSDMSLRLSTSSIALGATFVKLPWSKAPHPLVDLVRSEHECGAPACAVRTGEPGM